MRYNLDTDTTDMNLYLPSVFPHHGYPRPVGMDCVGDTLIVAMEVHPDYYTPGVYPKYYFYSFDYNFNILDSLIIDVYPIRSITSKDNILYYLNMGENNYERYILNIGRYDLITRQSLDPYQLPSLTIYWIKIFEDDLYFSDEKKFVGVVPLTALKN
jgi:hypothetical protein